MLLIKKFIVFIAMVIMSVINICMGVVSYFVERIAPLAAIIMVAVAAFMGLSNGFSTEIVFIVIAAVFVFSLSFIFPAVKRGMKELRKEMKDFVLSRGRYEK